MERIQGFIQKKSLSEKRKYSIYFLLPFLLLPCLEHSKSMCYILLRFVRRKHIQAAVWKKARWWCSHFLGGSKYCFVTLVYLVFTVHLSCTFRYTRKPGRKRATALYYDHPADQLTGAAPGCPWWAEKAGSLTNWKTTAANGPCSPTARTGEAPRKKPVKMLHAECLAQTLFCLLLFPFMFFC